MASPTPWQLTDVWLAWQPIVALADGHLHGYEALARGPRGSAYESPAQLFATTGGQRRAKALEAHLRRLAVQEGIRVLPQDSVLFVNVNSRWPDLPLHPDLAGVDPARIAIEITEAQPILENTHVLEAVTRWRRAGHPIVIDDYGTGYAAAAAVLALQPDILKLDRRLIADINRDQRRQAVVHSIREYTADLGVRLVAEGVETLGELETVRALGVDLAQGYLIARPAAPPPLPRWPLKKAAPLGSPPESPHNESTGTLLSLYALSIEHANLAAYVVDRQRRIVGWNGYATHMTGFSAIEMTGHRCFEPGGLRHRAADGRPLCFDACPLVWSMVHAAPHAADVTLAAKDGTRMPVRVLATPIWDPVRQRVLGAVEQFQLLDRMPEPSSAPGPAPAPAPLAALGLADPEPLPSLGGEEPPARRHRPRRGGQRAV